jgi:hypothetical protein
VSYYSGVYSIFHRFIKDYVDSLQPDKTNQYAYCYNNPVNLTDPLGLQAEKQETDKLGVDAKQEHEKKTEPPSSQPQSPPREGQNAQEVRQVNGIDKETKPVEYKQEFQIKNAEYVHSVGTYKYPEDRAGIPVGHSGLNFEKQYHGGKTEQKVLDWVGDDSGKFRETSYRDWKTEQKQQLAPGHSGGIERDKLTITRKEAMDLYKSMREKNDLKWSWEPNKRGNQGKDNCSTVISQELREHTKINIPHDQAGSNFNPINWYTENDRYDSWGKYSVEWLRDNAWIKERRWDPFQ